MSKTPQNPEDPGLERVQKVLSRVGIASRRQSEELIRQGRIEVNGAVVGVGDKMRPGIDELRFDGELVPAAPKPLVVLLNKPTGTLCSEKDPAGRPLVHHLVPPQLALRLVGRLDFNTEGVLLLTNDGELANKLSHPRHGVLRVYEARVRGIPTAETIARLIKGVVLDDGPARVESAQVVRQTDRNAWVRLTLTEGRNREVRRLMEKVGHPVMRLRRVQFAGLGNEGMIVGQWRVLHDHEVDELRERGHVGAFDLPPDPRSPAARPKRVKGRGAPLPAPVEADGDTAPERAERPSKANPARPKRVGKGKKAARKPVVARQKPEKKAKKQPRPTRAAPKPSRKSLRKNPGTKR